jgi:hypothetical protein
MWKLRDGKFGYKVTVCYLKCGQDIIPLLILEPDLFHELIREGR